jgi:hypothetical protein
LQRGLGGALARHPAEGGPLGGAPLRVGGLALGDLPLAQRPVPAGVQKWAVRWNTVSSAARAAISGIDRTPEEPVPITPPAAGALVVVGGHDPGAEGDVAAQVEPVGDVGDVGDVAQDLRLGGVLLRPGPLPTTRTRIPSPRGPCSW